MIARIWRGWALKAHADAYETFLRTTFLPPLDRIEGYCGVQVLRRDVEGEVEFVTITYFASLDAIRAFAGASYEIANVAPEARRLLARFEEEATHHDIAFELPASSRQGQDRR